MPMRRPTKISDKLLAGEQPTEADLEALVGEGVSTVINLRRDGEANQALSPRAEGEKAQALGLSYVHLPVSIAELGPERVDAFRKAVEASKGIVFVHCGMGQRACALALLKVAEDGGWTDAETLFNEAARKGVDLPDAAMREFIEDYFESRK